MYPNQGYGHYTASNQSAASGSSHPQPVYYAQQLPVAHHGQGPIVLSEAQEMDLLSKKHLIERMLLESKIAKEAAAVGIAPLPNNFSYGQGINTLQHTAPQNLQPVGALTNGYSTAPASLPQARIEEVRTEPPTSQSSFGASGSWVNISRQANSHQQQHQYPGHTTFSTSNPSGAQQRAGITAYGQGTTPAYQSHVHSGTSQPSFNPSLYTQQMAHHHDVTNSRPRDGSSERRDHMAPIRQNEQAAGPSGSKAPQSIPKYSLASSLAGALGPQQHQGRPSTSSSAVTNNQAGLQPSSRDAPATTPVGSAVEQAEQERKFNLVRKALGINPTSLVDRRMLENALVPEKRSQPGESSVEAKQRIGPQPPPPALNGKAEAIYHHPPPSIQVENRNSQPLHVARPTAPNRQSPLDNPKPNQPGIIDIPPRSEISQGNSTSAHKIGNAPKPISSTPYYNPGPFQKNIYPPQTTSAHAATSLPTSETNGSIPKPTSLGTTPLTPKKKHGSSLAKDVLRAFGSPKSITGKRKRVETAEPLATVPPLAIPAGVVAVTTPTEDKSLKPTTPKPAIPPRPLIPVESAITVPVVNETSSVAAVESTLPLDKIDDMGDTQMAEAQPSSVESEPQRQAIQVQMARPDHSPNHSTKNDRTSSTPSHRPPFSDAAGGSTTPPATTPPMPEITPDSPPSQRRILNKGKQPLFLPDSSPEPDDTPETTSPLPTPAFILDAHPRTPVYSNSKGKGKQRESSLPAFRSNGPEDDDVELVEVITKKPKFKYPIHGRSYRPKGLTVYVELEERRDPRRPRPENPGSRPTSPPAHDVNELLRDLEWYSGMIPCGWQGCNAVLDCVQRLGYHARRVHSSKPTTDGFVCHWESCDNGKIYETSQKLYHHISSKHLKKTASCPFSKCRRVYKSPQSQLLLQRHLEETSHKHDSLQELSLPIQIRDVADIAALPPHLPSYLVGAPPICPHAISAAQHHRMGEWVLSKIHGNPAYPGPLNSPKSPQKHQLGQRPRTAPGHGGSILKGFEFLAPLGSESSREMADLIPYSRFSLSKALNVVTGAVGPAEGINTSTLVTDAGSSAARSGGGTEERADVTKEVSGLGSEGGLAIQGEGSIAVISGQVAGQAAAPDITADPARSVSRRSVERDSEMMDQPIHTPDTEEVERLLD